MSTAYVIMHIPNTVSPISARKKLQTKILIEFLFNQLHFKNVTLDALFHGGHLVMRSKRCTVQVKRITLKRVGYQRCNQYQP